VRRQGEAPAPGQPEPKIIDYQARQSIFYFNRNAIGQITKNYNFNKGSENKSKQFLFKFISYIIFVNQIKHTA
jgi:hypothetical protein